MTTLFLDIETFSTVPINAGTHRYAEGSEIMLVAWALDDGPVDVGDLTSPETVNGFGMLNLLIASAEELARAAEEKAAAAGGAS